MSTYSPTEYMIEQSWTPKVPLNLDFYRTSGSTSGELLVAAPAAREILVDEVWSAKMTRALDESYADNVQPLDDFRATLRSPSPKTKRRRTGLCKHRNPPDTYCARCDR